MPLHAAGPYHRVEANLNQIYVSSCTPTLASLMKSRRGMQQKQESRSFLAISQADSPTAYLSGAVSETNLVRALILEPPSLCTCRAEKRRVGRCWERWRDVVGPLRMSWAARYPAAVQILL
ncbi:hypothetical protein EDD16DRAFT_1675012 [Pisolithus croceorrhizus]|nr:hypothetical protein EDD16DRAFT_1675012 [Pisolithus croceorrhizus]